MTIVIEVLTIFFSVICFYIPRALKTEDKLVPILLLCLGIFTLLFMPVMKALGIYPSDIGDLIAVTSTIAGLYLSGMSFAKIFSIGIYKK